MVHISKNITYFDYNGIDVDLLFNYLSCIPWFNCWKFSTVNEKLNWFQEIVNNTFKRFVPIKSVRSYCNKTPWFSNQILLNIKNKNKLHSSWKRNPSKSNWEAFVRARNYCNLSIRNSKKKYFSTKLNRQCSAKQLWKNLRSLRVISNKNNNCSLCPEVLNNYFMSNTSANVQDDPPILHTCSVYNPFEFTAVSENEVALNIISIKSNAIGFDCMPIRFIKLILPYILSTITHIINHCFTTSMFPDMWKVAFVHPIPKKSNASLPSEHRPISILPAISKTCERIMAKQIMQYVESHKLLSPFQSGFRAKHSCTTAMLKILDDIRGPFDCNQLTLLCLLDYSKAFDTINHKLLCRKLNYLFHFSVSATKLIDSYLCDRYQSVRVHDTFSSFAKIQSGVPQGSSLGPLLFSMFVNDLLFLNLKSHIHAFADDIQIYVSGSVKTMNELVTALNSDLLKIFQWTVDNGLSLNSSKSKVLPICYRIDSIPQIPSVILGTKTLETVSKAKNLGYIINSTLTCNDHIHSIISKIYSVLRMLRCSGPFVTIEIKKHLVRQLIIPYILFCSTVFSKLDALSMHKISVCFNHVTRYVFGLCRYDHISEYKTILLGVSIEHYLEINNLKLIWLLLCEEMPKYLVDKLHVGKSDRTRSLLLPKYVHLSSSNMFFVNAVRLWNTLPINLRQIASKSAFNVALHNYYKTGQK